MRFLGIGVIVAGALTLSGSLSAKATSPGAAGPAGPQKSPTWNRDTAADEPIQLIVSVPQQRVNVYVGGKLIANSPVSTGRKGYATPTGVFSILQKKRYHRSNIYSRAPMPYMQRLTWSGIALHASNDVPDRPASHGCVRLPPEFAKKLFGFTENGAHVIISDGEATPIEISHPNLFQPAPPRRHAVVRPEIAVDGSPSQAGGAPSETEPAQVLSSQPRDIDAPSQQTTTETRNLSPVRILVTRRIGRELVRDVQTLLKDLGFDPGELDGWMGRKTGAAIAGFQESRGLQKTGAMSDELVIELYRAAGKGEPPSGHIYVRQDFNPVFDVSITIAKPENPLGTHLFTAMDFDEGATEVEWLAVTLNDGEPDAPMPGPEDAAAPAPVTPTPSTAKEALGRIQISAAIRRRISEMLTPGSSLAITDNGISRETTDKGTDFVVLTR